MHIANPYREGHSHEPPTIFGLFAQRIELKENNNVGATSSSHLKHKQKMIIIIIK